MNRISNYNPDKGKLSEYTESKAADRINERNTRIECKLHKTHNGEKNYKQDLDVFLRDTGEIIGYIEVQTTLFSKFENWKNWQFYFRRTQKSYDKPYLHVQQDQTGRMVILTPKEYLAFYNQNPIIEKRYDTGVEEKICKLDMKDFWFFFSKCKKEDRQNKIENFFINKMLKQEKK